MEDMYTWEEPEQSTLRREMQELLEKWENITHGQRLQDARDHEYLLADTAAKHERICTSPYFINSDIDGDDEYFWRHVRDTVLYEKADGKDLEGLGIDDWENPFPGDKEVDADAHRRQQLKAHALAHISKMFAEAEAEAEADEASASIAASEQAKEVGASGLRPVKFQGVGMIDLGRHLDLASVADKLDFHGLTLLLPRLQRELPFPLSKLHRKRRTEEKERADPCLKARSRDTPVAFVIHSSGKVILKGARTAAQTQGATREIVTILGDARSTPELTVVKLDRGYKTGFPVAVDRLGDVLREQHILGLGHVVHDWVKLVTNPCAFPFRLKSEPSGGNITVTTYENGAVTVSGGATEEESTAAFERIYPFILQCRRDSGDEHSSAPRWPEF